MNIIFQNSICGLRPLLLQGVPARSIDLSFWFEEVLFELPKHSRQAVFEQDPMNVHTGKHPFI